jgi:hypothetical protein
LAAVLAELVAIIFLGVVLLAVAVAVLAVF